MRRSRDATVDALLREPGPRPTGGYPRRSGHPAPSLDVAYGESRSAGFRGTAVDFGHDPQAWRDGRMLAAAEGGAQAWVSMHPENIYTLAKHFQAYMGPTVRLGAPDRYWEFPAVVRAQSRMACIVGLVPVRPTCPHCRLDRRALEERHPDQAEQVLRFEADLGFELPSTARFVNRAGCGGCADGKARQSFAATVIVPDGQINDLLLRHEEEEPNFIHRDAHDVWRGRGGLIAEEVVLARILDGTLDPVYQDYFVASDYRPEEVANALAIARAEGLDVGRPSRFTSDPMRASWA